MASGKIWRRPPVLLALCLVSVGGVVTLLGHLAAGTGVAPKLAELSSDVGSKAYPAFAPDGQRLAYSARGTSNQDETFHIFVRNVTVGPAEQVTKGPANDIGPAWSPDGAQLAFVRVTDEDSECVVMPAAAGGEERKFPGCIAPGDELQPLPAVAWMGDGKSLVVAQKPAGLAKLTLADGKLTPLTHPPEGAEDSTPAISPDGGTIAFVRSTNADNADIFMSDAAGANPRRLTFDGRAIRGVTWSRDGQDIIYTGQRFNGWRVWRLPAYGGSPHDFMLAGRDAQYVTVASTGGRMVYTTNPTVAAIWRAQLSTADEVEEHALIRSKGREGGARYSPDGKSIVDISDQTGNDEIWLSDADGGNRVQVTSFKGPDLARIRWSPDGKSLLFDASQQGSDDLYMVAAAAGGKPKRMQQDAINGAWSHDGKWFYFQSRNRIWKAPLEGGEPQQLTERDGAAHPVESLDGKYIYFRDQRAFWRMPVGGGDEEQAIVPEHDLMWSTTLQPSREGMYYIEFERSSNTQVVSFYDYATKKSSVVFRLKNGGSRREGGTYSISPDGKYILYARVDQSQTNFEVVENFR
jgi:Tol biopolymer transport system component